MEDIEKKEGEEKVPAPSNREKFHSYMKERIPDYNTEDEEATYGQLLDYSQRRNDSQQKLTNVIREDPRVAQVLSDMVSGKRGAAGALARYFGKDFLAAEEGTPEYEEIMAAEEERKKDAEAAAESARKYKENMESSIPIIQEFCKEKGIDSDEFLDQAWEKVVEPILQGIYTKEICDILHKGFAYDSDVQDAMQAGEVKGRNTNINKMRSDKKSDGMPSGMTSVGEPAQRKREKNIVEMAMDA